MEWVSLNTWPWVLQNLSSWIGFSVDFHGLLSHKVPMKGPRICKKSNKLLFTCVSIRSICQYIDWLPSAPPSLCGLVATVAMAAQLHRKTGQIHVLVYGWQWFESTLLFLWDRLAKPWVWNVEVLKLLPSNPDLSCNLFLGVRLSTEAAACTPHNWVGTAACLNPQKRVINAHYHSLATVRQWQCKY